MVKKFEMVKILEVKHGVLKLVVETLNIYWLVIWGWGDLVICAPELGIRFLNVGTNAKLWRTNNQINTSPNHPKNTSMLIKRRDFLKTGSLVTASLLLPKFLKAIERPGAKESCFKSVLLKTFK